ncbi:hypothetical protein O181_042690 [Austropuccinia psidii MF-1]|uniref:Uncharacterized protein n=1 Tax=Austropuccinia psidii MF-1 TaxID=1389203 RepID=A0A9Q3HIF3_9BASI|nr:hypothetical protein [Austropuccinia psidii MF-1]
MPNLPCKQPPQQPTPGPSGTQWSEDLFRSKQQKFHLISTFGSSELTLPPFVEPSQSNEPCIPGQSPYSKPHEDILTCEPETEVPPMQSMEEPFGKSQLYFFSSPFLQPSPACPAPPPSIIIINDMPVRSALVFPRDPSHCPQEPNHLLPSFPRRGLQGIH